MLHTDLLGLLRLGQLRLDERQLLVQTIGLRTVLRRLRGQRSNLMPGRFQLPLHLIQLTGLDGASLLLPLGTPQHKAGERPQRRTDHHHRHHNQWHHHRIEHMFY